MLRRVFRLLIYKIPVCFIIISVSWVLLYKWAPVKWTPLMLKRSIQNVGEKEYRNIREWMDLEEISPVMVRAVLASEDSRFIDHNGFALEEVRKMLKEHKTKGKKISGRHIRFKSTKTAVFVLLRQDL